MHNYKLHVDGKIIYSFILKDGAEQQQLKKEAEYNHRPQDLDPGFLYAIACVPYDLEYAKIRF